MSEHKLPEELQERIGYRFRKPSLLMQALTHASFANEQQEEGDYERLEFLGDAVLEMVSSVWLYETYPELSEGEMTRMRAKLVCEDALFSRAEALDLKSCIRLGRGERKNKGNERPSIIADVTEALIGAIYLDGGIEEARGFILRHLLRKESDMADRTDYKTELQELLQAKGIRRIRYEVTDESGPSHAKTYRTAVYAGDTLLAEGEGSAKRKAEQQAAKCAVKKIKEQRVI